MALVHIRPIHASKRKGDLLLDRKRSGRKREREDAGELLFPPKQSPSSSPVESPASSTSSAPLLRHPLFRRESFTAVDPWPMMSAMILFRRSVAMQNSAHGRPEKSLRSKRRSGSLRSKRVHLRRAAKMTFSHHQRIFSPRSTIFSFCHSGVERWHKKVGKCHA